MKINKSNWFKFICENCFRIVCVCILIILVILGLCFTYVSKIKTYASSEKRVISVQYNVQENEIENGSSISQSFETNEKLKYFDIYFSESDENVSSEDKVNVQLVNDSTGNVVQKWECRQESLTEGLNRFYIDSAEEENLTGHFTLFLDFTGEGKNSSISFFSSSINQYNKGNLEINGISSGGDLAMTVYAGTNSFLYWMYVILAVGLISGGAVLFWMIFKENLKPEKIFVFAALVLGIAHMFALPAYSTPDERAHFATAYYYSNIVMGQDPVDENGNVLVRNEDLLLNVENIRPHIGTYALIADNMFRGSTDDTMVSFDTTPLDVPFWSYVPQTIGITVARLLGLGNIMLLALSDVLALLFYVGCIYLAIKLIPFGKSVLSVLSLLPMTLETAASFSYDVTVNGLSILFIGYVFYLAYEKNKANLRDWIAMAVLIFLLAPIKVVYVLLALLCILIPGQKMKKYWIGSVGVVAAGGISCLLLRLTAIMNLAVISGKGSMGTAQNTYTVASILADPVRVVGVLYNTLCEQTDAIFAPLYGQKLGYWDVSVPYYISFGFVIVLVLSLIMGENEKVCVKSWHKVLMFFLCAGMIGGITLSMMLDFTDVTDTMVRGIQGRYFIPFLPLVAFLFRGDKIVAKKSLNGYIVMAMYGLNYFALWNLFEDILVR